MPRTAQLLLAVLIGLCCASRPVFADDKSGVEAIGSSADAILAGHPALHDRVTPALVNDLGLPYCTATLISPRVVLTAAHCLEEAPTYVFFGNAPAVDGVFLTVGKWVPHPSYDPKTLEADVGVIQLDRAVPFRLPLVNPEPLITAQIGQVAHFVGFGDTAPKDGGESGLKRAGIAPIMEIDPSTFRYGAITCHGDSGGPAFFDDGDRLRLIGVTSYGSPDCTVYGVSQRADVYLSWIESQVAELDPPDCSLDDRCVSDCARPDPDCWSPSDPVTPSGGCQLGAQPAQQSFGPAALVLMLALLLRRARHARAVLVALLCSVASLGCSDDEPTPPRTICQSRPLGDLRKPAEIDFVLRDREGQVRPLGDTEGVDATDSGLLALSVRARNLNGCSLATIVTVREEASQTTVFRDGTLTEMGAEPQDDWWYPAAVDGIGFVTVPVVAGKSYLISAVAEDTGRRAAQVSRRVSTR